MIKLIFIILILFSHSASASEPTFPALTKITSVYEFPDEGKITVRAFGHIYKDDRVEVLILDGLEVDLGKKLIDPDGFQKIAAQFRGIKLETVELFKEDYSDDPNKMEWVYTLRFDCNAYAFDAVSSTKRDYWTRVSIFFDSIKVRKVKMNDVSMKQGGSSDKGVSPHY